jgi:hypothetical protein
MPSRTIRTISIYAGAICAAWPLTATGAGAQLVPGTRAPANAAEAIDDARTIVCTLAAAGRPTGGLNIRFIGGEGYAAIARLPDSLARFVPAAARQKLFEYKGAGGPLWIAFDPESGRCAIYAFTDAAAAEAKLRKSIGASPEWRPRMDAGAGVDWAFEWRPEPSLRLLTEISKPRAAGEPVTVVVRPLRR